MSQPLQQQTIRFEVIDTGIGIHAEQQQQIFRPFEQIHQAQNLGSGTGLGLAIARQLVELMGGQLHLTSQPGQGSKFWFEVTFPVLEKVGMEVVEPYRQVVGYLGEQRRILVVEDQPDSRLVLLDMLKPLGFQVLLADNAQTAVDMAQQYLPDLVLIDIMLPWESAWKSSFRRIYRRRSHGAIFVQIYSRLATHF